MPVLREYHGGLQPSVERSEHVPVQRHDSGRPGDHDDLDRRRRSVYGTGTT